MSLIKCKCGAWSDYGLTCTKCSLTILEKEEPEEAPEEKENDKEED